MAYWTQQSSKLQVTAACDVPRIDSYLSLIESQVNKMLRKGAEPVGQLQLTVTLVSIRTRTSLETRQLLVTFEVDAIYNGSRLNRKFNGKYFESSEASAAGCLMFFLGPLGAIVVLAQYLTRSFSIDEAPPEWIVRALDNCLIDLGVALDRLIDRQSDLLLDMCGNLADRLDNLAQRWQAIFVRQSNTLVT